VHDGVIDGGCKGGKLQSRWRFERTITEPATTGNLELKNP
jgi:hypothetical protein